MKVPMRNPRTGEIREVKMGWSWVLFLFSSFFGLPLFLRKLNIWGIICLALWALNFISSSFVTEDQADLKIIGSYLGLNLIYLGLLIFLGIKGNEMTAKNYLDLGWNFAEPDSDTTKIAKGRWGITT